MANKSNNQISDQIKSHDSAVKKGMLNITNILQGLQHGTRSATQQNGIKRGRLASMFSWLNPSANKQTDPTQEAINKNQQNSLLIKIDKLVEAIGALIKQKEQPIVKIDDNKVQQGIISGLTSGLQLLFKNSNNTNFGTFLNNISTISKNLNTIVKDGSVKVTLNESSIKEITGAINTSFSPTFTNIDLTSAITEKIQTINLNTTEFYSKFGTVQLNDILTTNIKFDTIDLNPLVEGKITGNIDLASTIASKINTIDLNTTQFYDKFQDIKLTDAITGKLILDEINLNSLIIPQIKVVPIDLNSLINLKLQLSKITLPVSPSPAGTESSEKNEKAAIPAQELTITSLGDFGALTKSLSSIQSILSDINNAFSPSEEKGKELSKEEGTSTVTSPGSDEKKTILNITLHIAEGIKKYFDNKESKFYTNLVLKLGISLEKKPPETVETKTEKTLPPLMKPEGDIGEGLPLLAPAAPEGDVKADRKSTGDTLTDVTPADDEKSALLSHLKALLAANTGTIVPLKTETEHPLPTFTVSKAKPDFSEYLPPLPTMDLSTLTLDDKRHIAEMGDVLHMLEHYITETRISAERSRLEYKKLIAKLEEGREEKNITPIESEPNTAITPMIPPKRDIIDVEVISSSTSLLSDEAMLPMVVEPNRSDIVPMLETSEQWMEPMEELLNEWMEPMQLFQTELMGTLDSITDTLVMGQMLDELNGRKSRKLLRGLDDELLLMNAPKDEFMTPMTGEEESGEATIIPMAIPGGEGGGGELGELTKTLGGLGLGKAGLGLGHLGMGVSVGTMAGAAGLAAIGALAGYGAYKAKDWDELVGNTAHESSFLGTYADGAIANINQYIGTGLGAKIKNAFKYGDVSKLWGSNDLLDDIYTVAERKLAISKGDDWANAAMYQRQDRIITERVNEAKKNTIFGQQQSQIRGLVSNLNYENEQIQNTLNDDKKDLSVALRKTYLNSIQSNLGKQYKLSNIELRAAIEAIKFDSAFALDNVKNDKNLEENKNTYVSAIRLLGTTKVDDIQIDDLPPSLQIQRKVLENPEELQKTEKVELYLGKVKLFDMHNYTLRDKVITWLNKQGINSDAKRRNFIIHALSYHNKSILQYLQSILDARQEQSETIARHIDATADKDILDNKGKNLETLIPTSLSPLTKITPLTNTTLNRTRKRFLADLLPSSNTSSESKESKASPISPLITLNEAADKLNEAADKLNNQNQNQQNIQLLQEYNVSQDGINSFMKDFRYWK